MHDENTSGRVRLLHHVRQVMTVISRKGGAQNHEIEMPLLQGLLYGLAADSRLDAKSSFLKRFRLAGQDLLVLLSVKNFHRRAGFRHSGSSKGYVSNRE